MDRCTPSVVARCERTLLSISPRGSPDTLTEAVSEHRVSRGGARSPGATGMAEGAAAVRGRSGRYPTPLEILDGVHARIRTDAEEPHQLPAWQGLVSRSTAALGDVLVRLRQLPADRDRAVRVHWPVHGTTHRVCVIILVH
jgi:hypothetical protein